MTDIPPAVAELIEMLAALPGAVAIVLGGSRAVQLEDGSDWDLGVYYRGAIDLTALSMRGTVFPPGSWGRVMNGGAWLECRGEKVDVILRDLEVVEYWTKRAHEGEIELPAQTTAQCDATIALEYTQRDTVVSVEGSIENGTCAASGGDYTIVVSFRGETGELKTLEFGETWQRSDDQPVEFSTDYKIGENADLVGVRSRRLRCVCADTPGD